MYSRIDKLKKMCLWLYKISEWFFKAEFIKKSFLLENKEMVFVLKPRLHVNWMPLLWSVKSVIYIFMLGGQTKRRFERPVESRTSRKSTGSGSPAICIILIARAHQKYQKEKTVRKSGKHAEREKCREFRHSEEKFRILWRQRICAHTSEAQRDEDNGERGSFSPHALLINATRAASVFSLKRI